MCCFEPCLSRKIGLDIMQKWLLTEDQLHEPLWLLLTFTVLCWCTFEYEHQSRPAHGAFSNAFAVANMIKN